ncbi:MULTISPECIES: TerD family protein [Streptomyces]|uniref:Transport associated protein n=1 Tax=Streptomyces griseus subsp. griseus (strain JCM 4626 / CBS 651.72 / NBRC 13350 / KCC S-0626 / ISP 5235) TaxID=455632 RepID=B1W133_STRGG|nr:TerD family protein [Streptomyces griseus]MYR12909.1 TerD family protein [Streptomyces sp. SID724]NEB53189.1 TerD family protein [Streptomyces griseus]SEE52756.1 Stress response protein SCP2 [Streptomyces griseus]SQA22230.1 stress protein [Streptomyces griseus]BAG22443.1 putative transport associated protein [Streptomyces griseus subsp. griseus NBRC 13350]
MTAMTPGSNIPLSAARVAVDVAAPVRLDVSGLLLTADGKVRSDDDFIFYNQPSGPGVTYRSGGGSAPDAIVVDTAAVPPGIEKIVVTASPDAAGQTFQGVEPTATVRNADDGSALATFTPPRLGTETALVVIEIYLRNGAWKARAVGQGYANGLAGIATDFGVSVEEPAAPVAPPAPTAPAPVAPVAAPVDPRIAPPAPAAPPAPPAAPAGSGKINLDKGRVNLQKNQTVSLVKGGAPLLSRVRMGLGWEPAFRGKDIDLDASVIAYGPNRNHLDSCYFGKLTILNGAIKHSGDNLTGEGAGDDEVIMVDLGRIPAEATGLVFTVNSFTGQKFNEVAKAYCRLIDDASGEELVRFDLTGAEPQTGVMMAKLIKQFTGEWEMTAMGEFVKSRTVRGMVKPAAKSL